MLILLLKLFATLAILQVLNASVVNEVHHPNVIIMHVNNLLWDDLGIHTNRKDSENSTPNIDRLAYSGIILNRFYANGGLKSLFSGCYQRSLYGNPNLMTTYFERNGYNLNFIARNNYDKVEAFERELLNAIPSDSKPSLIVADFGHLGEDIKIPFIDEIVGSVVTKAHKVGVLSNTIMLFISMPDDDESPLEIDVRRTAFVYSPLLKLQQRVSNQMIHVTDLLPTLVNASSLQWRTRDRIFIDGINQWQALNTNEEERLDVYGDNFYINHYWKLSFGSNDSAGVYGSIENENMESDRDMTGYDFETYVKSVFSSELHLVLDKLTKQHIMFARSRARVHCNLKDIGESAVEDIRCSRAEPCLFDLLADPCEFDNKHEHDFDSRRQHMKEILRRYLNGEKIDEISVKSTGVSSAMEDGTMVGVILGASVFVSIFVFVIVVCVKEKCNRRRSVYYDKTKKKSTKNEVAKEEASKDDDVNAISVISHNSK